MTRDEAMKKLNEPLYDEIELINDKRYVANKLSISEQDLDQLINSEPLSYDYYKSWDSRYKFLKMMQAVIESLLGKKLRRYF